MGGGWYHLVSVNVIVSSDSHPASFNHQQPVTEQTINLGTASKSVTMPATPKKTVSGRSMLQVSSAIDGRDRIFLSLRYRKLSAGSVMGC